MMSMMQRIERARSAMQGLAGARSIGIACLFLLAAAGRAGAQAPINDFFTNATVITGISGSVTGSTFFATVEAGEPVVTDLRDPLRIPIANGASVWFRWIAPVSGTAFFNSFGSAFDTVMAAYDGTNLNTMIEVAGNDDSFVP